MIITRAGSTKNHGSKAIQLPKGNYSVSQDGQGVTFSHGRVKDFAGDAHHSYFIEFKSADIEALLTALAVAARTRPDRLEVSLAAST